MMVSLDRKKVFSLVDFRFSRQGLVQGDKVFKAMKEFIPDSDIAKLKIPYSAVAVDLNKMEEVVFRSGSLYKAIIAKDLSISPLNRKLRVAALGNGSYQVDLPDGINIDLPSPKKEETLRLFPNPLRQILNIEYNAHQSGKGELSIISANGELVYSRNNYLYKVYNTIVLDKLNV